MNTVNNGIDHRLFTHITENNQKTPFYRLTGMKTKALGKGEAEMSVIAEEDHSNPLGLVHGGMISTLADAAMGNAIRTVGKKGVTADYRVSFFKSAPIGKELIGYGKIEKMGARLIFASAVVVCEGETLATSQGTFFIIGDIEL